MTASVPQLFGTDGIRGPFGSPPLERDTVTRLGLCLAHDLIDRGTPAPKVVVGGDTRASTPELTAWLDQGLRAGGATPLHAGTIPTPGVAFLILDRSAAAGVVVSASHNPYPDNGIKILDGEGFKLDPQRELELERRMPSESSLAEESQDRRPSPTLLASYVESLVASLPGNAPLRDLSLVLDTGNGAASEIAEPLFTRLGAEVELLHSSPDGRNVNDGCGSTAPQLAAARVREAGHDLGFAFDGDADRVVVCDEQGVIRDGDEILYLWAIDLAERGQLTGGGVVATSMSNLGLERALASRGIGVVRCGVGDRQVVRTLRERGLRLGGEQSGHIVDLHLSTTGDGLLTALQFAHVVSRGQTPSSQRLAEFERFPQILLNVPVVSKPPLDQLPGVVLMARQIEKELGAEGRLVLRYSGTESLARIMIEGPDDQTVGALAEQLAAAIHLEIGSHPRPASSVSSQR